MKTGVLAGAVGIGALALSDRLERAWLGRAPVYAPDRIATRLFALGSRRRSRAVGAILRWSYGLVIAGAWNRLVPSPRASVRRALGLGAAILAFELWALPALGATPPLRRWSRAEKALLAWHTQVFGFGEEAARRLLSM
jgi:hypothetical protein